MNRRNFLKKIPLLSLLIPSATFFSLPTFSSLPDSEESIFTKNQLEIYGFTPIDTMIFIDENGILKTVKTKILNFSLPDGWIPIKSQLRSFLAWEMRFIQFQYIYSVKSLMSVDGKKYYIVTGAK